MRFSHPIFLAAGLLSGFAARAQHPVHIVVRDSLTHVPLPLVSVVVHGSTVGAPSDGNGLSILENVPGEAVQLDFSLLSYHAKALTVRLP